MDHSGHGHHGAHHMEHQTTSAHDGHLMPLMEAATTPTNTMDSNSGGHMHGSMSHMMKSYFHTTYGDIIFFENWILNTYWDTVFTCLVFFILAMFYEGLKCYREYSLKKTNKSISVAVIQSDSLGAPMNLESNGSGNSFGLTNRKLPYQKAFSKAHVIQSFLHVVQVAISYSLMLAFMTFNVWLCLSILLGAGVGYFAFCWRKITIVDVTEHCH